MKYICQNSPIKNEKKVSKAHSFFKAIKTELTSFVNHNTDDNGASVSSNISTNINDLYNKIMEDYSSKKPFSMKGSKALKILETKRQIINKVNELSQELPADTEIRLIVKKGGFFDDHEEYANIKRAYLVLTDKKNNKETILYSRNNQKDAGIGFDIKQVKSYPKEYTMLETGEYLEGEKALYDMLEYVNNIDISNVKKQ